MRKVYAVFVILITFVSTIFAGSTDSISTVYKDREFISQYQTKAKISNKVTDEVAEYLVNDFHKTPDNLFNWALKDLGLQNKNDELLFILKTSDTDYKTGVTHGKFDIVVQYITTFKDVKVDAIVAKTKYKNSVIKVSANIIYSTALLKKATGIIRFIPVNDNEQIIVTDVNLKFGWFFNIFITKKRYKSIVEWRIKKFTENIKNECLKRQNGEIDKKYLPIADSL